MHGNPPDDYLRQSHQSGVELAQHLQQGGDLPHIQDTFRMWPGEFTIGETPVTLWQFTGADVEYSRIAAGGFGIVGLSAMGASALFNLASKANASRRAAPQWRATDQGTLTLTNQRVCLQISEWCDFGHQSLNKLTSDGFTIELHYSGAPALRLQVAYPHWWVVAMYAAAFDQVVFPPALPPTPTNR